MERRGGEMQNEERRTKNVEVRSVHWSPSKHFFILRSSFLVCLLLALSGCAGYHVGTAGLFPSDIHTVFVPMFESDSFRRDLGEQLTEAVCKEIESRGPMKVVGTPNADSVLTGRITTDT